MADQLEVGRTSVRDWAKSGLDVVPVKGAKTCTISESVDIESITQIVEHFRAELHNLELRKLPLDLSITR